MKPEVWTIRRWGLESRPMVACVASVSVWFRSKERPRKGTFGFDRARNETRAKKWKKGRWKGRKETSSPPPRSFTCATFLAVFDSRSSFFSPKPYGNACYAGYSDLRLAFLFCPKKKTIFLIKKLLCTLASAFKKILKQGCVQAEKNLCNSSKG